MAHEEKHGEKSSSAAPRELPEDDSKASAEERRISELHARVERDFRHHPPAPGQDQVYEMVRVRFRDLAHELVDLLGPGRELSLALTKLEEAMFAANAGIARNG